INKGNYAALEREFTADLQAQLPLQKLQPLLENLVLGAGKVKNMGIPKLKWKNVAVIPVEFDSGLLDLRIDLDSMTDKIAGFYFQPHIEELPVPERNSSHLGLPFAGEWAVMWGGDTKEVNPHHDTKNQRFAIDFNVLQGFEKSHKENGKTNEDYFAFGKEVLSPGEGKVVEAIDGVHDNAPFVPNAYSALGNCIIIKHAANEFSVLSHLKMGSLQVKAGDTVTRGQVIAQCGNSGNSSEPELQYHLQNTANIEDATGIKVYFDDVILRHRDDLTKKKTYSPVRDDKVRTSE
ncbi:MAG: M23 family metallopeptidase, partial [Bacteroidota bacterium]|nr:M23 family metallopeptidase [Bacteroidota bacterium]